MADVNERGTFDFVLERIQIVSFTSLPRFTSCYMTAMTAMEMKSEH